MKEANSWCSLDRTIVLTSVFFAVICIIGGLVEVLLTYCFFGSLHLTLGVTLITIAVLVATDNLQILPIGMFIGVMVVLLDITGSFYDFFVYHDKLPILLKTAEGINLNFVIHLLVIGTSCSLKYFMLLRGTL